MEVSSDGFKDTSRLTQIWTNLNHEIISCGKCPRLVDHRQNIARERKKAYRQWDYWGKPVTGFGDPNARLLLVGLAPGAHGSNRTGRMFTGDSSGNFLYNALFKAGFASQPVATSIGDGLCLNEVFITAVCRCVPPGNRPALQEIINCQPFLLQELRLLENLSGIVALGQVAFDRLIRLLNIHDTDGKKPKFRHAVYIPTGNHQPWILAAYHPSRQNTQTGRLTVDMFDSIWEKARDLLNKSGE